VLPGPSKLAKLVTTTTLCYTQGKFHPTRRKQYDVTSITIKLSSRSVKSPEALLICVRVPIRPSTLKIDFWVNNLLKLCDLGTYPYLHYMGFA